MRGMTLVSKETKVYVFINSFRDCYRAAERLGNLKKYGEKVTPKSKNV